MAFNQTWCFAGSIGIGGSRGLRRRWKQKRGRRSSRRPILKYRRHHRPIASPDVSAHGRWQRRGFRKGVLPMPMSSNVHTLENVRTLRAEVDRSQFGQLARL
jgi:hypothetical protein